MLRPQKCLQMTEVQQQFVRYLEQKVHRYVDRLEKMFGPRDQRFVFGTVRQSNSHIPRTHFPFDYHEDGGCVVDILIGQRPWENRWRDQGTWQVAHECVHLLDPVEAGTANVLEEGLATWFQDEPQYHDKLVKRYITRNRPHPENYAKAKWLVLQCQRGILPAVKEIRSSGTRIRDITPEVLAAKLPDADRETIDSLCTKFE